MIRDPRIDDDAERSPDDAPPPAPPPRDGDDLDLDLEEIGDSDRLKEGFTGQER